MRRSRLRSISDKQRELRAALRGPEAHAWWLAVVKGKPCAVCGRPDRVQGHHVISQQTLRKVASERGLDVSAVLWDERNGIPVCESEHSAHTSAKKRIPRSCLPLAAFQFAAELGLTWLIERDYPKIAQDVS